MAKKNKEKRGIDVGKILSLCTAGWSMEAISEEMGITVEKVMEIVKLENEKLPGGTEEYKREKQEQNRAKIFTVMTDKELSSIYEKAAAIGAKEALKTFEQERKKEYSSRADRRLRNTKLLLKNYRVLKEHAEHSVFGRTQIEESAIEILESMMSIYDNEVIIESIKRSATRTAIIVSHIEVMFELYRSYCERTSSREIDLRRYDIVWDMYLANNTLSVKEIAEKYNISTRNAYEDLKIAIERLSALIFGVDGLNVH